MRTSSAAWGSAAFFVAAPGTFVGLIPWLITRWELHEPWPWWPAVRVAGVLLIVLGLIPAVHAFVRFALAGGTPMPLAPTQHLVVSGPNRYIRNPMYAGLLLAVVGQALLFGQLSLLWYAALFFVITAIFVRIYEEPTLLRTYGAEYEAYRRAVPAWWPRLRPWTPEHARGQKP